MIKSMTGYGKSELVKETRSYRVEIRSVNHRYLDISVKMPRIISYLEDEVKKEISKYITRGKVEVYITFEDTSAEGKQININKELAKAYIQELRNLAMQENISANIEVTEITKFPDVLKIENSEEDEKTKEELLEAVTVAAKGLVEMRTIEGNKIAQDLSARIDEIEGKTCKISSISTGLIDEYVVKLESRIKLLLKNQEIDEARLAQEVVIYADKCSIEEEITRLKSHILQFRDLIKSNGAIGRKIDFIIQEMNRETNTIGSKANNLEITNGVIDIKTQLENIREQIQNIE